jgi:hypothetical protein
MALARLPRGPLSLEGLTTPGGILPEGQRRRLVRLLAVEAAHLALVTESEIGTEPDERPADRKAWEEATSPPAAHASSDHRDPPDGPDDDEDEEGDEERAALAAIYGQDEEGD